MQQARHRWEGKKGRGVDRTYRKRDDRVVLNAIGISGEVMWARYFGVPWYQNPGEGGDHHRDGDLQLRSKAWVEVKTSRNGGGVKLHRSTGDRFDYLAFAHFQQKEKKVALVGIVPKARIESDELVKEAFGDPAFLFRRTITMERPAAGDGLLCPWCIREPWPCKQPACVDSLGRREGAA